MSWFEGKRVLVPIDFGETSREAVDAGLAIAQDPAQVHVIHVAPALTTTEIGIPYANFDDTDRRSHLEQKFSELFPQTKYRNFTFSVEFGDPGSRITEIAEEQKVDLIVMPSHGRTGVARLLIGSVAERVVRLAHCPVLILRK